MAVSKDYKDARKWVKARPGYLKKSSAVTRDAIRNSTGRLMGITDVSMALKSLKKTKTVTPKKAVKTAKKVVKKVTKKVAVKKIVVKKAKSTDILSKEIRNKIYIGALKILKDQLKSRYNSVCSGLCALISSSASSVLADKSMNYARINAYDNMNKVYPEIASFRPKNAPIYWFPRDRSGSAKRLDILNRAIEATK